MRFRHQGKRRSPGDGGANSGLLGSFGGTNDGEGKSHQVYQLIIADRFYNPGQVARAVAAYPEMSALGQFLT